MNPLTIVASSCPLILCAIGALFSEYAGILALFLDGMISFSAFMTFTLTTITGNPIIATLLSAFICCTLAAGFSLLIEKLKADDFISGIALNLIFSSIISMLSFYIFGNRGVLTSPDFVFNVHQIKIITIIITALLSIAGILFISRSRSGIYLRITGSDANVLLAKGVNPKIYRVLGWSVAAFYATIAGSFLAFRISSYVPNISSGRGWMALAAVFLGKKKGWKIIISVLIFAAADIFSSTIQNYINIPSSLLLAFPYLIVLVLILVEKK